MSNALCWTAAERASLTFTFTRSIGADDVTYIPEASSDLTSWEAVSSGHVVAVTRNGSREFVTVRDDVPLEGAPDRFFRLRVQLLE